MQHSWAKWLGRRKGEGEERAVDGIISVESYDGAEYISRSWKDGLPKYVINQLDLTTW